MGGGEILYTSHAMALFGLQDAELQLACFRAYNDWLAEFCSSQSHAAPRNWTYLRYGFFVLV